MPYQPYQSTWQNPYLQQIQQPQYSPVVPSVTTPYTQPSQYQQQPMAQQMSGVVKVDGPDEAMNRIIMRYGYDMQGLREAMSTASPEEREKMMREMRTMLGM